MTLFGSLFHRRPRERLTGVVQRYSAAHGMAWIMPHLNVPEFTVSDRVLRRSKLLRDPLRAGDRVEWEAREGAEPRRLYRYRKTAN